MRTLPNLLSILRIILTPLFVLLFWQGGTSLFIAIFIFTVASFTDLFDGFFARRYKASSKLGSFLDPIADKILIGTTFVCLFLKGLTEWWVVFIILFRDLFVTGLRIGVIKSGSCLVTSMAAKWKTVAQFVAIYVAFLWLTVYEFFGCLKNKDITLFLVNTVMYTVAGLTIYTGLDYLIRHKNFKKQLRKDSEREIL